MRRLVVAPAARLDAAAALRESRASFGPAARARYALLLRTAYRDLQSDPERREARGLEAGSPLRLYHLRHSRMHVPTEDRVSRPRHVLAFSYDAEEVLILRVLHDRMDAAGRLTDG